MGGLGPGIGGLEYVVIGLAALLVLGPERLPVMMRQIGKWVGKARRMADEFRASFDELARQSELDDLRKEVEALRQNQGMHALGRDADAAFKDIGESLKDKPAATAAPVAPAPGVSEWPDPAVDVVTPVAPAPAETAPKARTTRAKAAPKPSTGKAKAKPREATAKGQSLTKPAAKPRASRKKAADQ